MEKVQNKPRCSRTGAGSLPKKTRRYLWLDMKTFLEQQTLKICSVGEG